VLFVLGFALPAIMGIAIGSRAIAQTSAPWADTAAPEFNGSLYAATSIGTTIYVGGTFTAAITGGHTIPRRGLAAFDAITGHLLDWRPAVDGTVRALTTTRDSVYAAGDFRHADGEPRDSLAQFDPATGALGPLSHRIGGTPYALAGTRDRLYLGGHITRIDGLKIGNLAAFATASGAVDRRWTAATDGPVYSLAASGNTIYAGGDFRIVGFVPGTQWLAALDATSGQVDTGFQPTTPAEVRAIAISGNQIYVAVGGVGGHFDKACTTPSNGTRGTCTDGSEPRVKLAAITAAGTLTTWAPQANGIVGVRALAINPASASLEAGGDFTTVGGVPYEGSPAVSHTVIRGVHAARGLILALAALITAVTGLIVALNRG